MICSVRARPRKAPQRPSGCWYWPVASSPPDAPEPGLEISSLRELLRAGPIWGAEIDTRFRVLALTVEPAPDRHPDPDAEDRRLQVLLYPVATVAAALVQHDDDGPTVLRFEESQLPDVVAALEGPVPSGDPIPEVHPDLDAIADRLSLRGQATVGDGILHHLHLVLRADDLSLELWASFDEAEVRPPTR